MAMPVKMKTWSSGRPKPAVRKPLTIEGMVESAARSAVAWVRSGCKVVGNEDHRARLEVCSACDEFTGRRCKLCGCNMWVKTKLATTECPDGKW